MARFGQQPARLGQVARGGPDGGREPHRAGARQLGGGLAPPLERAGHERGPIEREVEGAPHAQVVERRPVDAAEERLDHDGRLRHHAAAGLGPEPIRLVRGGSEGHVELAGEEHGPRAGGVLHHEQSNDRLGRAPPQ